MKLVWTRPSVWDGFGIWILNGWAFRNRHGIRERGLVVLGWELTWEASK